MTLWIYSMLPARQSYGAVYEQCNHNLYTGKSKRIMKSDNGTELYGGKSGTIHRTTGTYVILMCVEKSRLAVAASDRWR